MSGSCPPYNADDLVSFFPCSFFGEMKCRVFFVMAFEVERVLKDGSSKSLAAFGSRNQSFYLADSSEQPE